MQENDNSILTGDVTSTNEMAELVVFKSFRPEDILENDILVSVTNYYNDKAVGVFLLRPNFNLPDKDVNDLTVRDFLKRMSTPLPGDNINLITRVRKITFQDGRFSFHNDPYEINYFTDNQGVIIGLGIAIESIKGTDAYYHVDSGWEFTDKKTGEVLLHADLLSRRNPLIGTQLTLALFNLDTDGSSFLLVYGNPSIAETVLEDFAPLLAEVHLGFYETFTFDIGVSAVVSEENVLDEAENIEEYEKILMLEDSVVFVQRNDCIASYLH